MFGSSQSLPLFRVAGISVTASWSWLIALGYVVFMLTGSYEEILGPGKQTPAFAYAVVVSFLFFGSIVLHELGHAIVARRNGIGIMGIELWVLGGLAKMDRDPRTPGVEFRVAVAGPLATLAVAAVCLGAALAVNPSQLEHLVTLTARPGDSAWLASVVWLGVVNVFLLAFNLIPAFPLDGGRIARAAVWRATGSEERGTKAAAGIGRVFGAGLMVFGVLEIGNDPFFGAILLYMGFSIMQSARSIVAQRELLGEASRLTVADVMDVRPVAIAADASIDRALEEFFWRYGWQWFPVVDSAGRFVGLIEQQSVDRVDESDRGARLVGELVAPQSASRRSIQHDTPLTALLANADMRDHGAMMAVDRQGMLRGVITIEQVHRALREAVSHATRRREPPQSPDRPDPPPTGGQ